jgi:signal transduction histidine kinase/DNA-binding response OmpR family regulator/ligand-binding sensor domain-containing protein
VEPAGAAVLVGRQLALGSDRTLWVRAAKGLYRLQGDRLVEGRAELMDVPLQAIGPGLEGRLWLATRDGRLAVLDGEELRWTGVELGFETENPVVFLAEDGSGTLWLGTGRGPAIREGDRLLDVPLEAARRRMRGPGDGPGAGTLTAPDRLVWTGWPMWPFLLRGSGGAVWKSDGASLRRDGRQVLRPSARGGNRITDMAFDRDGGVWVVTSETGLYTLRPAQVRVLGEEQGLPRSNVYAMHRDRYGVIWIADSLDGVTRVGASGITAVAGEELGSASAIYDDPGSGRLLLGAAGLQYVTGRDGDAPGRWRWPMSPWQVAEHRTRALLRHRGGRLLLANEDGLWLSRPGDPGEDGWRFELVPDTAGWDVRVIRDDGDGGVWLGTSGAGIAHLGPGTDGDLAPVPDLHLDRSDGLASDLVRDLHLDAGGVLWIATEDRGLVRLDPAGGEGPVAIQERHGLWDDSLHRILDDGRGWFWLSTNRGIFRVRRSDLEAFAAGEAPRVECVGYTEDHGMRHREANEGVQDAGLRDGGGRLWFPTQDGVAILDPARLVTPGAPPPVHLLGLESGDLRLVAGDPGLAGRVRLRPEERSFSFRYTALDFRSPENVRFRYRLEGYDDRWLDARSRRTAFFTKVPPGEYTFHVQARSGDGTWNLEGDRLAVTVNPFLWETGWARGAGLLLVAGLAGAGLRLRERRSRRHRERLESLVAARTVELERQRDTVARQAEKLAELDGLRSRLFADVSHEFRTPLTLVLGGLGDLLSGSLGELPGEARKSLEVARRSAERLRALVEEVLETARLEAGRLQLRVRQGDLVEFLSEIGEAFLPLAERRGLGFELVTREETIPIWADPDHLEKVFANLLANAMRYTPRGGRVEMMVGVYEGGTEPGKAWITVRDEGSGIALEDRERIFDRFYRAAADGTVGGTGLGLPLARSIADLHGGTLELTSPPGQGCTFRVELPLGRDHFEAALFSADRPWRRPQGFSPPPPLEDEEGPCPEPVEPAGEDRTKVLVVDDSAEIRSYVRRHLEPRYRVIEAADGEEALARARVHLPDLVVSDLMMPRVDGHELCRALARDPELDWVPVVLLTARADTENKLEALGEGADDYLTKPFDVRELVARIDNLIASRRRLRERFGGNGLPSPGLPLAEGVRPTRDDLEWLERVRYTLEEGFAEESFSVETLARRMAVHRSRLHERLRQLTGLPPVRLVAHWRLERAAALLRNGAGSVSEVAYDVGYQSVEHFSRSFRKRYGRSPSEFRRAIHEAPPH